MVGPSYRQVAWESSLAHSLSCWNQFPAPPLPGTLPSERTYMVTTHWEGRDEAEGVMSHPVLGLRFTFLSNLQQKVRWLAGPLVLTVLLVFSAWVVLLHVWVLQSSNWPSLCAYVVFRLLHGFNFPLFPVATLQLFAKPKCRCNCTKCLHKRRVGLLVPHSP